MTLTKSGKSKDSKYGRPFLSAPRVPNGTLATVDLLPYQELTDYGDGPKLVNFGRVKLYVEVDGVTEYVWTPGEMAASYLIESWSKDENAWIGRVGKWDIAWAWKTQKRSGRAVALVPVTDTITATQKLIQPSSEAKTESKAHGSFQCPACEASFGSVEELASHLATHTG